jgi:hypothetical protein
MIYDKITRQILTLIGRYPPQDHIFKFGTKIKGKYQFVKVRYGEYLPGFSGGYPIGEERDVDLNFLVADDGIREIMQVYNTLEVINDAPPFE